MSQSPSSQTTPLAAKDKDTARKRYVAPRLEAYGSLQDLTRTSYIGSGADFGFYTNSVA